MRVAPLARRHILLLAVLSLICPLAAWGQRPACTTKGDIRTTSGPVCGLAPTTAMPAASYLGIPFAQAKRWQQPQPPQRWTSTLRATHYGNMCPQPTLAQLMSTKPDCSPSRKADVPLQSEDCLDLNIWVPPGASPAHPLPVMVFIYGGAFVFGSADQEGLDGAKLAAAGNVIVVNFNYRLGALGYLVDEKDGLDGNLGFRDQIAALQWVQANIGAFGGDAGNVTIFGQSAGAMSVGLHALVSPRSAGLFKAAIMESNPVGLAYMTPAQAAAVGKAVISKLDCSGFSSRQDCLKNIDPCELVAAESQVTVELLKKAQPNLPFAPVIDGDLITRQPMAALGSGEPRVPMIVGTNRNEGTLFATLALMKGHISPDDYRDFLAQLVGPQNVQAVLSNPKYSCDSLLGCTSQIAEVITDYVFACASRHLAAAAPGASYVYEFTQSPTCNPTPGIPFCEHLDCHGAELAYVFDNPRPACHFRPDQVALSQAIQAYWTSFARSHSPAGPAPWPALGSAEETMILSLPRRGSLATAADPWAEEANCALWDRLGYQDPRSWERLLPSLIPETQAK
jgi:carboxylesterase type B